MSKKKVSGNTMTLKDFHGGSIPSDLPLPSAPGVTVRPSDRPGYDRPASWGTPMGRPDHWSRPHTSPATRHFDDKIPFLSAPIGRNFDEDERKPLDGISVPRRTISDESFRAPPPLPRVEVKPEYGLGGSSFGRQVTPLPRSPVGTVNSYSARFTESVQVGMNSQSLGISKDQGAAGGGYPNVWSMRKEVAGAVEPEQSAWSGANAVSKLAHASALDTVSSGRWQSKAVHYQTEAEVVRPSEIESRPRAGVNGNGANNRMGIVSEKEYSDEMLARQAERGLGFDNQKQGGRNGLLDHERSGVSKYSDVRPRSASHYSDGAQPARTDAKLVGPELQHHVPSEPSERPKLKLLPRTKPLESSEPSVTDHAQGYRQVVDSSHVGAVYQPHGHADFVKPVSTGTESGKDLGQRPKLNLKPKVPLPEQSEGTNDRSRNALFGGARPRELVLKERGVDDVVINNLDVVEHSNRVEQNISRPEKLHHDHPIHTRYGEKTEDAVDQRAGRKPERKEQRVDGERVNGQRRNWRAGAGAGDNRRNPRETDRQQVSERQPSPETWRKPAEPANSSQGVGSRYRRAASAVELAQAFSKPASDSKVNDRFPAQRSINTGRTQMPFSRLVNGY